MCTMVRYMVLGLDSRSQECEKAKTSLPIISPSFHLILIEFGAPLRLVDAKNLMLILSCPFYIQGREPTCDFIKKRET